ncbi:MAG: tryptophan--tRNA ligase, partial [Sedimenticola sp.]
RCPVWEFHKVYSGDEIKAWVQEGCKSAGIGCVDCKQPIIDAVLAELKPIQARAREFEEQPELVRNIIAEGNEDARDMAQETMAEVRQAMSMLYR